MTARSPRRLPLALSTGLLAFAVVSTPASAHQDDPKALDKTPKYDGMGYRAVESTAPAVSFAAQGVQMQSWVSIDEFPGSGGAVNDCWGYVSPAGNEYALVGLHCGTGIVDITNPANAQILTVISGPCCTWRDIKTYDTYAYVVAECGSRGIQVLDLSQIDEGIVGELDDVVGVGPESHNVALDEDSGYLYRTGGNHYGLGIYDLNANPAQPVLVGEWTGRYVHDAQVHRYDSGPYAGREIAFCCAGYNGGWIEPGLDIVDVTDKANPVVLAQLIYENGAYSHQGWLSQDGRYFYLGDELDEQALSVPTTTQVIDVTDLENPSVVTTFTNGNPATGHNIYVRGKHIFQANYSSGLRIFDATNPTSPIEVGYFDTRPADDGNGFAGLWSNYPFFPSGTVIGSDRQSGLFVFSINLPTLGDLDSNGDVDLSDLLMMLSAWGACGGCQQFICSCPTDITGDGVTGFQDLLLLLANWTN